MLEAAISVGIGALHPTHPLITGPLHSLPRYRHKISETNPRSKYVQSKSD